MELAIYRHFADSTVDILDLLTLLANRGPCP